MRKLSGLILVLFVFLLGLAACSEGSDCYSENTSTIKIEFFQINNSDPDTSFFETDTLVLNSVYAIGNEDSLIARHDTIVGTLILPVDPLEDTTAYRIGRDLLIIQYDIRQRIMSPDCGVEQVFSNLDTIANPYDSLVIKSRNLDEQEINFQVYSR